MKIYTIIIWWETLLESAIKIAAICKTVLPLSIPNPPEHGIDYTYNKFSNKINSK